MESPFVTGMVAGALEVHAETPAIAGVIAGAVGNILSWRPADGLFRFFRHGIDPDLDDIALLHTVLLRHRPASFDPAAVAALLEGLVGADGRYPVWVRPASAQNEFDPCVQANVVNYLCRCGRRPDLGVLRIAWGLWREDAATLHYESPFTFPYFLARLPPAARRSVVAANPRAVAGLSRSRPGATALDQAFQLAALRRLGGPARADLVERLLAGQGADGAWPAIGAFGALNFWGSSALTTALAAEALALAGKG
ncbi:hypothetical protein [Phaeospirillum tilakii]|uniref:Uncharacterized protein n=1 Tax=Phaeospirillum tilakii TaxID=741673 RepID=A0ABW5C632_9PROT